MEERVQQLEQECDQKRAKYDAPISFLHNQFPGARIPDNICGLTSQSQIL